MATLTITTTAAEALRMATVVGSALSLGRVATAIEIKTFWVSQMKQFVLEQEKNIAKKVYEASLADVPYEPT